MFVTINIFFSKKKVVQKKFILDKNGNIVSKMETFGNIWKHFRFFQ